MGILLTLSGLQGISTFRNCVHKLLVDKKLLLKERYKNIFQTDVSEYLLTFVPNR